MVYSTVMHLSPRFLVIIPGLCLSALISFWPHATAKAVNWSRCQVEHGEASITPGQTTKTVTLNTPISDPNQAFVLSSATGDETVQNAADHMVSSAITSQTQVTLRRVGTVGTVNVSYSVVQCREDEFYVEDGTATIDANTTTTNHDFIPQIDDADRSIVLVSAATNDTSSDETSSLVTAAFAPDDSAVVVLQRAVNSPAVTTVNYQIVTFAADTQITVQTNELTLSPGAASQTSTLVTPVSPDRSWVYCSYDASDNGLQQTAVACSLANDGTAVIAQRHTAAAYTNRVRYYVVTWPDDTVIIRHGNEPINDSNQPDGERVVHDITINSVGALDHAFVTLNTTVNGTAIDYPRHRWLATLLDTTTIRTSFWRSDPSNTSDANFKFWQVAQFPLPYRVTGWGWIGNSTTDGTDGTALISFSCENLTEYYFNEDPDVADPECANGTLGTRHDYGVSLEHGGCGAACDISGTAWVGDYDDADSAANPIGMITFDPDVSNAPLSDDSLTPGENEGGSAHWNEITGEVYGWARFVSLENYERNTLGSTNNNWGWIRLRGHETTDNAEYGVKFNPTDLTFSGWGWNDIGTDSSGGALPGTGFGWVQFDLFTSGTVSQAWLKTSQGDVYSQGGINVNVDASQYGEYGATYLILANGDVVNFGTRAGEDAISINSNTNAINTNLGTVPTHTGNAVYRGALGTIHVNELIRQAEQDGHVQTGNCTDSLLSSSTNPLNGAVYYCAGDLSINNNLTFYNAPGSGLGNGTIVVGGNLYLNDNLGYYNDTIDQHINNLASVAFIVLGQVEINPGVTNLVGAYVVLGDANAVVPGNYDFFSGSGSAPLTISGLVMARSFNFQRTGLGTGSDPQPAEHIRYDGRIFANPPPGLEDFVATLPSLE